MSDPEPQNLEPNPPEVTGASATAEEPARWSRPLPLAVAWALAPAMAMTLAGVGLELGMDDELPSLLLALGILGGIPALFFWSVWMVLPANWTTAAKVLSVPVITVVMCAANLFLAGGACAVIDPPFNLH